MDGGAVAAHTGTAAARRCALVATALGFSVVQLDVTAVNVLDVTAVNVAMQPIGAALGGSTTALQWIVNAYTLGLASLILSAGAWGNRVGAKRVYVGGFAVFTLASAACGLAPSLGVLIRGAGVQGIGSAALIPCSLTLLIHSHPGAERARAVGIWAACASLALSAGPVVALVGFLRVEARSREPMLPLPLFRPPTFATTAAGGLLVSVAFYGLIFVLSLQLVLLGFGLGVLVPTITTALLGSVEATRSGGAAGTLNTARQTGSVIGVALFGSFANGRLVLGLRFSLLLSIALALVAAALTAHPRMTST
jgi:Major Facilitator Superfamily